MRFFLPLVLSTVAAFAGADKKPMPNPVREAGNEAVDIYATPYLDKAQIKTALGAELPDGIIAIAVRVVPKGDPKLSIARDDFQIISHRDGQRSGPFVGSQIAGSATLVVSTVNRGGGLHGGQPGGPIWGGMPGTMGRPRQMGDPGGGVVGSGTAGETEAKATTATDASKKDNPLVALLNEKMLPDKETNEPVAGFLYFPLEGKQKVKDLELIYKGPAGRLFVDFGK